MKKISLESIVKPIKPKVKSVITTKNDSTIIDGKKYYKVNYYSELKGKTKNDNAWVNSDNGIVTEYYVDKDGKATKSIVFINAPVGTTWSRYDYSLNKYDAYKVKSFSHTVNKVIEFLPSFMVNNTQYNIVMKLEKKKYYNSTTYFNDGRVYENNNEDTDYEYYARNIGFIYTSRTNKTQYFESKTTRELVEHKP